MAEDGKDYPPWLVAQRGKPYRSPGYLNRNSLIRRYALHVRGLGRDVAFEEIRQMLRFVDRGYSPEASQISRALAPLYRSGKVAKAPKGAAVSIDGAPYASSRAAAEAFGISPQTVLNRIRSDQARWRGWRRLG